jgi:putative NADPH-quinone reductase
MYIVIRDDVPDFIAPTLVAHSVLNAHIKFQHVDAYRQWLTDSFKKVVVRVSQATFTDIIENLKLPMHVGHEKKTCDGADICIVCMPVWNTNVPNILKCVDLWKPKTVTMV